MSSSESEEFDWAALRLRAHLLIELRARAWQVPLLLALVVATSMAMGWVHE